LFADPAAAIEQALMGVVDEVINMLRAIQDADEAARLFETAARASARIFFVPRLVIQAQRFLPRIFAKVRTGKHRHKLNGSDISAF
jgi:hypothetical protein